MLRDFCHLAINQSSVLVNYVHKRTKAQCQLQLDDVILAVDIFLVGNAKFVHIICILYIDWFSYSFHFIVYPNGGYGISLNKYISL